MQRVIIPSILMLLVLAVACSSGQRNPASPTLITTQSSEATFDISRVPREVSTFRMLSKPIGGAASDGDYDIPSTEYIIDKGLYATGVTPTHIAFRGTATTDVVRCEWRGSARTLAQREREIRFWFGLDDDDPLSSASKVEDQFMQYIEGMSSKYQEFVKARFLPIAKGGLTEEYLFLTCYASYVPSEYLLGAGPMSPSTLSVAYDRMGEARSYGLYKKEHDVGQFGNEELMSEGEYQDYLDGIVRDAETELAEMVGGRESVVMLAPMGAHNAIAIEAWQAVAQWDLQKDENEVVHAVRYGAFRREIPNTRRPWRT